MNFLEKAFSPGGIVIDLEVPPSFSWDDESLPVNVTLTGGKKEHTVAAIELELSPSGSEDGEGEREHIHEESFALAPGQTIQRMIAFRLSNPTMEEKEAAWAKAGHPEFILRGLRAAASRPLPRPVGKLRMKAVLRFSTTGRLAQATASTYTS